MLRLPNGYGSVIRLKGRRRKPYAVRISIGHRERICVPNKAEYYPIAIDKYKMTYCKSKNHYVMYVDNDEVQKHFDEIGVLYRIEFVRQYKYLEYFEKSKDAYAYLAKMNNGDKVKEHASIASEPSFKDVYDQYIDFMVHRRKKPSESTLTSWKTGFNCWSDIHGIRFKAVTTQQLQDCISDRADMSQSTVGRMMTIVRHMYKYGIANGICDDDRSKYIFVEYSSDKKIIHRPFTKEEMQFLWNDIREDAAKIALILCYTGMRGTELMILEKKDIHLDKQYCVTGIKTANGINRIIPIHNDIVGIVKDLMERFDSKYLYPTENGNMYMLSYFCQKIWDPYMEKTGLNHYTHDGRHTCSTKMEASGIDKMHRQLILGHALSDVTDKVYTHVAPETLVKDMNSVVW